MKSLIVSLVLAAAFAAAQGQRKFTGVITDSMCSSADHKGMRMGPTDADIRLFEFSVKLHPSIGHKIGDIVHCAGALGPGSHQDPRFRRGYDPANASFWSNTRKIPLSPRERASPLRAISAAAAQASGRLKFTFPIVLE